MSSNTEAVATLAKYFGASLKKAKPLNVVDFAEKHFIIPETTAPIKLQPFQKAILNYALDENKDFQNIVYSTVKKSGKTTIAALVARWVAETWGPRAEVYCMANDMEQARGRIYQKALDSIELNPNYNRMKRELPGKWKIIERQAVFLPDNNVFRAVSGDYKGEAGSNPTATFWSELWGFNSEASRRLWSELTPVPTRERSIRFVETYAGYEDESDLLWELYQRGKSGVRLTHDDIDWPFSDQPPIWVNPRARQFTYWDDGEIARRMPWQTPEYYAAQEETLTVQQFQRLHLNIWTSSTSPFLPIEWWYACGGVLPPFDRNAPVVIGVDAAVTSDCCAIVGVSRHPDKDKHETDVVIRFVFVWEPPKGGAINLEHTIGDELRRLCKQYNVVEVAYDKYQLHNLMTNLTEEEVAWCREFSQMSERNVADKQLYDIIRDRHLLHEETHESQLTTHIKNSATKQSKDEDTKMRIIKKKPELKIDAAVATSMACAECLRLSL